MRIQLIRKLADHLNGVDVSDQQVGAVIDLPTRQAELLVAEGWARPIHEPENDRVPGTPRDASCKERRKP